MKRANISYGFILFMWFGMILTEGCGNESFVYDINHCDAACAKLICQEKLNDNIKKHEDTEAECQQRLCDIWCANEHRGTLCKFREGQADELAEYMTNNYNSFNPIWPCGYCSDNDECSAYCTNTTDCMPFGKNYSCDIYTNRCEEISTVECDEDEFYNAEKNICEKKCSGEQDKCTKDEDCCGSFICLDNVCQDRPIEECDDKDIVCKSDKDCCEGLFCLNSKCVSDETMSAEECIAQVRAKGFEGNKHIYVVQKSKDITNWKYQSNRENYTCMAFVIDSANKFIEIPEKWKESLELNDKMFIVGTDKTCNIDNSTCYAIINSKDSNSLVAPLFKGKEGPLVDVSIQNLKLQFNMLASEGHSPLADHILGSDSPGIVKNIKYSGMITMDSKDPENKIENVGGLFGIVEHVDLENIEVEDTFINIIPMSSEDYESHCLPSDGTNATGNAFCHKNIGLISGAVRGDVSVSDFRINHSGIQAGMAANVGGLFGSVLQGARLTVSTKSDDENYRNSIKIDMIDNVERNAGTLFGFVSSEAESVTAEKINIKVGNIHSKFQSVGGLIGLSSSKQVNLSGISLNADHIISSNSSGGLIGILDSSNVDMKDILLNVLSVQSSVDEDAKEKWQGYSHLDSNGFYTGGAIGLSVKSRITMSGCQLNISLLIGEDFIGGFVGDGNNSDISISNSSDYISSEIVVSENASHTGGIVGDYRRNVNFEFSVIALAADLFLPENQDLLCCLLSFKKDLPAFVDCAEVPRDSKSCSMLFSTRFLESHSEALLFSKINIENVQSIVHGIRTKQNTDSVVFKQLIGNMYVIVESIIIDDLDQYMPLLLFYLDKYGVSKDDPAAAFLLNMKNGLDFFEGILSEPPSEQDEKYNEGINMQITASVRAYSVFHSIFSYSPVQAEGSDAWMTFSMSLKDEDDIAKYPKLYGWLTIFRDISSINGCFNTNNDENAYLCQTVQKSDEGIGTKNSISYYNTCCEAKEFVQSNGNEIGERWSKEENWACYSYHSSELVSFTPDNSWNLVSCEIEHEEDME